MNIFEKIFFKSAPVYPAYERIYQHGEQHSASHVISQGWQLGDYPLVKLDKPMPWHFNSEQERSWNFYLHCFDMIHPLLVQYDIDRSTDLLRTAVKVALDWIEKHTKEGEVYQNKVTDSFAWYDMAVGIRAYRLAYIYDAATDRKILKDSEATRFYHALKVHREYLADSKNIVFHNNHGLYQVLGQLALSRRFCHKDLDMAAAHCQGLIRLENFLTQQFTNEGVHREHSPDYHRMVYEALDGAYQAGLVDNRLCAMIDKIARSLQAFVLPNGYLANFGDSDYRKMPNQHALDQLKVFRESGYVTIQTVHTSNKTLERSYLAQQAGFHSRTHKHADDLTIIWYEHQQSILVDSGRYGYLGKTKKGSALWMDGHWYDDPNRVYCESTRAHNVLEIDGLNYQRRGRRPYGSAIGRVVESDGVIAIESSIRPFRSMRIDRVLFYKPGNWLIVFDWFKDNANAKHDLRQWFHFAPDIEVSENNAGFTALMQKSDKPLQIIPLEAPKPVGKLCVKGQKSPNMQGFFSPKEGVIEPNIAIAFSAAKADIAQFATLFAFSDSISSNIPSCGISLSGQRGKLSWHDDQGLHLLTFSRPRGESMQVKYRLS